MKRELLYGAPPNSWFTNASKANPVILLLDGHASHTQSLELIDEARNNGVTIICFPPHTTHKLQPGDVGFMRPLSAFYGQAVTAWLRSNPEATDIELNAEERRSADGQQPPLTPLDQNTLQLPLPQEQGMIRLPQTLQPSQSVSQPSTSISDERHILQHGTSCLMLVKEDENVSKWMARVRSLAADCGYGGRLTTIIRDTFILEMGSGLIRDRLFEEDAKSLTTDKAVEIAQTKENISEFNP
ncbi:hypothetical protein ILUMI_09372 [Ignelater luminosus]|uniref:DDE-1 domain-containing protein n=1 Tax=Ignelater luminosus TaxID=2038154 RepID=A0A8K0GEL0_IGNLU|nr:hypothetical protein ILUMI_09372 [Ignelater luminosus]